MRIGIGLCPVPLGALVAALGWTWAAPAAAQPSPPIAALAAATPAPAAPAPPPAAPPPPAGLVITNPASIPTPPGPPPPPPPQRPLIELTTLRILAEKGVISRAEYDAAMKDLQETMGAHAAASSTLTFSGWKTTLYGFAQADMMYHSTQSFPDYTGNFPVARPDTLAGSHGRFQASVRDTRIGLRVQAPPLERVRASALIEMDFLGPTGTVGSTISEGSFFNNPNFRIRHAYLKVETPVVDVLFGHAWRLFGSQPNYFPAAVQWIGMVGELFGRTMQLRASHTFKTDLINVDIAAAAMRPPQRDAGVPAGEAALRIAFNKWTSWHTGYMTATGLTPASIAISGDVRQFRMPEFAAKPKDTKTAVGGGIAASAYLPIIPAKAAAKDNSLSVLGEFVTGRGINDHYIGLTGGVAHAALPNPGMATPAPEYASTVDAGLAVYNAEGTLRLPRWTTFLVSLEYYLPAVGGRVGLFANYGHAKLHDAATYPNPARVRDHESSIGGGFFVDPIEALRFGVDYAHIEDVYADGVTAKNEAAQVSGFFFF